MSPDGKNLFLKGTVSKTNIASSFIKPDAKILHMVVTSLNEIYDHYKALGFDEVYFSVIPNPVSIIAPGMGNYNHRTESLQHYPGLKLPYIDIYEVYKAKSKSPIFQRADTHWSYYGFGLWVNEFNKRLVADSAGWSK